MSAQSSPIAGLSGRCESELQQHMVESLPVPTKHRMRLLSGGECKPQTAGFAERAPGVCAIAAERGRPGCPHSGAFSHRRRVCLMRWAALLAEPPFGDASHTRPHMRTSEIEAASSRFLCVLVSFSLSAPPLLSRTTPASAAFEGRGWSNRCLRDWHPDAS